MISGRLITADIMTNQVLRKDAFESSVCLRIMGQRRPAAAAPYKMGTQPYFFLHKIGTQPYFFLCEVSVFPFFGRPTGLGCNRRPRRNSRAAINLLFPAGRPVRVQSRIVASIFSSSFSASHLDQSSVLAGTAAGKGESNGSLRSPQ